MLFLFLKQFLPTVLVASCNDLRCEFSGSTWESNLAPGHTTTLLVHIGATHCLPYLILLSLLLHHITFLYICQDNCNYLLLDQVLLFISYNIQAFHCAFQGQASLWLTTTTIQFAQKWWKVNLFSKQMHSQSHLDEHLSRLYLFRYHYWLE